MARITELSKEASRKYDGLRQLHGEKNARELTVIWLKKQDIVKDAKISEDERTISIILKNDVRMNILTR